VIYFTDVLCDENEEPLHEGDEESPAQICPVLIIGLFGRGVVIRVPWFGRCYPPGD